MSENARRVVLVVGHGSRRAEANEDVREAARLIGERGGFSLIAAAFLEIEHPNISEGFAQLVERGAQHITVHPYFLSPGRHTRGDIPVEVREAASEHPGITYEITEPLAAHRLVIEASIERIRETQRSKTEEIETSTAKRGTVYLVGAGPGDPGLITVKARDLLASCDVIIYDNLVNPELLRHAPASAERIYVGKVGGGRQTSQERINYLLVEHASAGKRVVRLKGGDPFLFGRGGEEAEALRASGLSFEVVPGISSALAVPAYAGIPLTHRGLSSSVAVVTGARAGDGAYLSGALARGASADTIVVLMGAAHLHEIASELMAAGRSSETPAAVIRWGTYEGQQTITGTLDTIAGEAERAGMRAPSVIIVGEVVRLRERLKWFESDLSSIVDEELEPAYAAY
ncbi:MAG: uroporphyrinogen methyltransferase / synthase [Acidobacteriota bacterium]|jgi:uroporphyrin-III C-methyltransferase|nr:uroporphyrinogen methyltransferase / synthase [Acidobacteriota bacterium]